MPDTFKPGDLVRWIGEWPYPLVAAPPRDNTVLSIEADGRVRLEGRYDGEGPQRWSCLPEQLVHREPPAPTTAPAAVDPDKWGPCPDDPTSIAALCPHGWVELTVQQGTTPSTPDSAPEGYQDIQVDRVWGLDYEVAKRVYDLVGDLADSVPNLVSRIPHGTFGLLCRVYFDEGNADVGAASYYGLEVSWGTDGLPVFNLPPTAGETA